MNDPEGGDDIVVIGLGYVGLPVAAALARHFPTTGLDIDEVRVGEIRAGHDRTGEIDASELRASKLRVTSDASDLHGAGLYIVTVPTPVDSLNRPDLRAVIAATRTIAHLCDRARRPTVVYESTVYPGVTEDVCGAILEQSGLKRGLDFRLGYSPERINPGDRLHGIEKITKVIAGEDDEVLDQLERIYGSITSGGVFRAASIKAAEAAKAIENAQRDINIAFMNEVAQITAALGLSVWDVLDAARTKWNFLPFAPGLVGGHCIGVDPYYLSHVAEEFGIAPNVVLAGRSRNDGMAQWIAGRIHEESGAKPESILVLGATFKENVPDLRNSKVVDLARSLQSLGHNVRLHDPVADPQELAQLGFAPLAPERSDVVIGAVAHEEFASFNANDLQLLVKSDGLVADVKGMWRGLELGKEIRRWSL